MAHTKSGGSTKLGRDSRSKRLGVKKNHGEFVSVGQVIIRQRGTKYIPGRHVGRGADDTLFALTEGTVLFVDTRKIRFDGSYRRAKAVRVIPGARSAAVPKS